MLRSSTASIARTFASGTAPRLPSSVPSMSIATSRTGIYGSRALSMNVRHWGNRSLVNGSPDLHQVLARGIFRLLELQRAVQIRERGHSEVREAVHEHLAVPVAVHHLEELLQMLGRRLLERHRNVHVGHAVLDHDEAFAPVALLVRHRQVDDDVESRVGEQRDLLVGDLASGREPIGDLEIGADALQRLGLRLAGRRSRQEQSNDREANGCVHRLGPL